MTCLPRMESTSFLSIIVVPVNSQNSGSPLCSIYAIFRLPSQHRCEKPDKRLTHFSWCSELHILAHITSSRGVRWPLSVTLLRNSGMSSLQWFAPPEKPPSSDAPSTFWPAQFSNPPLVKPLGRHRHLPLSTHTHSHRNDIIRFTLQDTSTTQRHPRRKSTPFPTRKTVKHSRIRSRTATTGFTPFRALCTRCPRNARTFGTRCDGLWRGSMD